MSLWIEWPMKKRLPRINARLDAGELGIAIVAGTETTHPFSHLMPMRRDGSGRSCQGPAIHRVEIEIYTRVPATDLRRRGKKHLAPKKRRKDKGPK